MARWFRWTMLLTGTVAAITVPFLIWGEAIEQSAIDFLASKPGRWTVAAAIVALLALDIVLPVPSSIASTAAGALLGFPAGLAASWAGMSIACAAGYGLGARARSTPIAPDSELRRAEALRDRYGEWALVLLRPVPVLAEASVLFAGLTGVAWSRFLLLTSLANLGISSVYAAAGAYFSGQHSFPAAFAAAILLPGAAMWLGARR